jgi:hypothetical protein
LAAKGLEVVASEDEVQALLRTWRVRSSELLEPGFLQAVVSQLAADRLLLVDLDVNSTTVLLYGRWIDAATGRLLWADVVEEKLTAVPKASPEEAGVDWAAAIERAGRRFVDRCREHPPQDGARNLVVLPSGPIGSTATQTQLGMYCLLRSLLEVQRWRLPDPALVTRTLEMSGCDAMRLERRGRDELTARYAPAAALQPRMMSFDSPEPGGVRARDDGESEALSPRREERAPLGFSLLAIDCASGSIVAAPLEYIEPGSPIGLFGVSRDVRWIERLQTGADRLVRSLRLSLREN